jgi:hypothetical protein
MSGEKRGPKPIQINWEEFDKLCALHCTLEEFACYFDCSVDTIENKVKEAHGVKFSEYFNLKKGAGKVSLRRKQFQVAMKGNPTMLLWLGKQWLDQKDKQELSTAEDKPIQLNYSLDE